MDRSRVRFSRLVRMYVRDDRDEDRRSQWMCDGLERYRFRRRIQSLSRILEPTEHRLIVALRNTRIVDSDDVSASR